MKKEARSQKSEVRIETWDQANTAMGLYALQAGDSAMNRANLEASLAQVRANFEAKIQASDEEVEATESALKKFAQAHKAEFNAAPNGDGRSYEHAGVVLGFRQSPGRVEIRKEEEAIEWLRDFREGAFVRIVHQANREALLDVLRPAPAVSAGTQRLVETLAAHGIKFEQKDKFFLEVL